MEESSRVSEQQQRNDEQQCPSCVAELTEASVLMIAASETDLRLCFCFICNFFLFSYCEIKMNNKSLNVSFMCLVHHSPIQMLIC